MLNLGQVVYDLTNKRVLIYGGIDMYQNQETAKCHSISSFLTEELQELFFGKDKNIPFQYSNFAPEDGIVPIGEFVAAVGIHGHYFGCLDWKKILKNPEWATAAKRTIETAKDWPKPIKKEVQS